MYKTVTAGWVVLFVLLVGAGLSAQVFPEEEVLTEVFTTDGSMLRGRVIEDGNDRLVLEVYGGSTFVIHPDNIERMREIRNPDFGAEPETLTLDPLDLAALIAEAEEPAATDDAPPADADALTYRAYQWRRWDVGREWSASVGVYSGMEWRPREEVNSLVFGSRARFDWGERHSAFGGYELAMAWVFFGGDSPYRFREEHIGLSLENVAIESRRFFLGYGRRYSPLNSLTFIPGVRLGLEQEGRVATAIDDGDREFTYDQGGAIENPDYEYGEQYWVGSLGAEVTAELNIRRFLLFGTTGAMFFLPNETDYNRTLQGSTDSGLEFPFEGTIERGYAWYANLGVGYGFGGDERAVTEAATEEREYRSFEGDNLRIWGLHFYPAVGFSGIVGPDSSFGIPGFSIPNLGFELSRNGGTYFGLALGESQFGYRFPSVLYEDSNDESGDPPRVIEPTLYVDTWSVFEAGVGRRQALTESFFLKGGLHVSFVGHETMLQADERGDLQADSGGIALAPKIGLEYSLPGTASTVFTNAYVFLPGPVGGTEYAFGFDEAVTADAYGEAPAGYGVNLGVLFRLFGNPSRLTAAEQDDTAWLEYRDRNDLPESRFSMTFGTGIETVFSGDKDGISGVQIVFPVTLGFRRGIEATFTGGIPLGESGIGGVSREYTIVDDTTSDVTRVTAVPHLNRILSVDLGYRFFRSNRLSVKPSLRLTETDYEIWGIEDEFNDGTVQSVDDFRFEREKTVMYMGPAIEGRYFLSDRFAVIGYGSWGRRMGNDRYEGSLAYSTEIYYEYVPNLFQLGLYGALHM
ncbi:MAG: hypothetical protein ACLFR8_02045 [Alkalispirochaeta sp.]